MVQPPDPLCCASGKATRRAVASIGMSVGVGDMVGVAVGPGVSVGTAGLGVAVGGTGVAVGGGGAATLSGRVVSTLRHDSLALPMTW